MYRQKIAQRVLARHLRTQAVLVPPRRGKTRQFLKITKRRLIQSLSAYNRAATQFKRDYGDEDFAEQVDMAIGLNQQEVFAGAYRSLSRAFQGIDWSEEDFTTQSGPYAGFVDLRRMLNIARSRLETIGKYNAKDMKRVQAIPIKFDEEEWEFSRGYIAIDAAAARKNLEHLPVLAYEVMQEILKPIDRINMLDLERGTNPTHDKVETLWHASVNAADLYRSGFSAQMPGEDLGTGLGGAQGTGTGKAGVSFTSDLYVAKEIARSLKEAVMVAKGKVTAAHILSWSKRDGTADRLDFWFRATFGRKEPDWGNKAHVMDLYRAYLRASEEKGIRYDPVFLVRGGSRALVRKLVSVQAQGIGVLQATINMSEHVKYKSGEREWRVPPEDIISIDKLLR